MEFSKNDNKLVNDLQNLILKNAGSDPQILEVLKSRHIKIRYSYFGDIHKNFYTLSANTMAFYSDLEECVFLAPDRELNKRHVLMHEMCHAYSKANDCIGFFNNRSYSVYEGKDPMDIFKMMLTRKYGISYIYANENRIINEAATEFYASEFLNEEPVSYNLFLPIYANLSKVCGYDKLKNLYFNHDDKGLILAIQDAYHLKDDYLIKKLFMLLDASCNIDGIVSDKILSCAYQVFLDININKVIFEHDIKSDEDLMNYVDIEKLITYKGMGNEDNKFFFEEIVKDMDKRLANFDGIPKSADLEQTKKMVNEFVCKRLTDQNMEYKGYDEYKEYFKQNLGDVFTYLNQETYFKINGQLLETETPVNTVLNFISSFMNEIDFSKISKVERNLISANMFSTKHNLFCSYKKIENNNKDENLF